MKDRRILIWFRNDLRLQDNHVVQYAQSTGAPVVCFYCLEDIWWEGKQFGIPRMGDFRKKFTLETVLDLHEQLKKAGNGLIVKKGSTVACLQEICDEFQITEVVYQEEGNTEEWQIERDVIARLLKKGIRTKSFWQTTLVPINELPMPLPKLPEVFTAFRNKVEREFKAGEPLEFSGKLITPLMWDADISIISGLMPVIEEDQRCAIRFRGGETEAFKRLRHYLWETNAIATYKETRNGLVGPNYSSKFSAWLSVGAISPLSIAHEVWCYEEEVQKNDSTYWMIFELLWRDFFHFTSRKQGNKMFLLHGFNEDKSRKWRKTSNVFEQWTEGRTGDEFVDANMLELKRTGWMSNRGRQNVASYLVHDLGLDWRLGAAWFEMNNIDYDVHSNWGNWAYIAGVGNDPRKDRKFNTQKQAMDYDRDRTFRNLWLSAS